MLIYFHFELSRKRALHQPARNEKIISWQLDKFVRCLLN